MEDDKVVLEIEGNLINCSKAQLAKESVYFEVMFGGDFIEKSKEKIELRVIRFKNILKHLQMILLSLHLSHFVTGCESKMFSCNIRNTSRQGKHQKLQRNS